MKLYVFLIVVAVSLKNAHPFQEKQTMELRPLSRIQVKERMQRDLLDNAGTRTQRHLLANDGTHTYTMKPTQHDPLANVGTYIHTLDRQTQHDIMIELIEEHLTEDNAKLVLNFVSRQPEDFLYAGYLKIFETIKMKSLKDGALFELANQVKTDLNKGQVSSLSSLFPKALWSLFTSAVACIKNKAHDEYFYAEGMEYAHDDSRRNVYTWIGQGQVWESGKWKLEYIGQNKFHIKSNIYNEYLYAEEDAYNLGSNTRSVFTWVGFWSAGKTGNVWAFQVLDENDVFIRNVNYDEFIYSYYKSLVDEYRRNVLSWIPKGINSCDTESYQCRWEIIACD